MKRIPLSSFVLLMVSGCSPALYRPTPLDSAWMEKNAPGVSLEQLEKGRNLYVERCADCHRLRRPEKYEAKKWPSLVDKMKENAHLSDEEKALIVTYLQTTSKRLRK